MREGYTEKYERGLHWRIVKLHPKPVFDARFEMDFQTREAAVEWLRTAPESWGSKAFIKGL